VLLAQSGHPAHASECPLFGGKTDINRRQSDVCFDPKRTFALFASPPSICSCGTVR
jgi:hypothetical protein